MIESVLHHHGVRPPTALRMTGPRRDYADASPATLDSAGTPPKADVTAAPFDDYKRRRVG